MIADVCIGKQSGNPVMEAEATVSGGMEKVKQRWGRRGFCQWASFQRTVVGGKIIIFLLNRDRIGFSFFFFFIGLLSSVASIGFKLGLRGSI